MGVNMKMIQQMQRRLESIQTELAVRSTRSILPLFTKARSLWLGGNAWCSWPSLYS